MHRVARMELQDGEVQCRAAIGSRVRWRVGEGFVMGASWEWGGAPGRSGDAAAWKGGGRCGD